MEERLLSSCDVRTRSYKYGAQHIKPFVTNIGELSALRVIDFQWLIWNWSLAISARMTTKDRPNRWTASDIGLCPTVSVKASIPQEDMDCLSCIFIWGHFKWRSECVASSESWILSSPIHTQSFNFLGHIKLTEIMHSDNSSQNYWKTGIYFARE